ncbi:MAG: hypothetical protein ACLUHG_00970 [Sutterella wadsworthensis]
MGTLNSDWSITASDGTTLKMSVLTNGPRRSAEDLTDAVFKASAPKKGTFAGVRYVERTNTRAECRSPSAPHHSRDSVFRAPLRPTTRSGVDAC